MPFRLLKYNIATIEDHLHQKNKHFPVVVNIVFYHGKEPWNYSTAFADYYQNPELGAQSLYMAPFTLVRLPAKGNDEIYRDKELGFCFLAFRCTSSSDPYEAFSAFLDTPIFKEYFQALPADLRYLVISYLGKCISRAGHSLEKLVTLAANNTKEKEEMMVSIAQEYINKGMEQGREQGMQQGLEKTAKNMLSSGLSVSLIGQVTGLSRQAIAKLRHL